MNDLLEPNHGYKPLVRTCDDPQLNFARIRRTRVVDGKTVVAPEPKRHAIRKVRLIDVMNVE